MLASRHGKGLYLLLHKTHWDAAFGDASLVILRELKVAGRLWINAGPMHCQAKLRATMPKDRVYAVRLTAYVPLRLRLKRLDLDQVFPERFFTHRYCCEITLVQRTTRDERRAGF